MYSLVRFLIMVLVSMAVWMAIGLGVGFLLHRFVPAIDLGMATLIGVVTLGAVFCGSAGFRPWRPSTVTTTSNGLKPHSRRHPRPDLRARARPDFSYRMWPHGILGSRFSAFAVSIREPQHKGYIMHPILRMLWLAVHHHWCSVGRARLAGCSLGVLLGLGLMLVGCNNSGNQGHLASQSSPPPAMERQVVANLLTLYLTALRQADIDRVDALLSPAAPQAQAVASGQQSSLRQGAAGAVTDVEALRATLSATFRTRTVTALDIPTDTVRVAPDNRSVTFLEIETTEASATLVQQTRLFRTTWALTQDEVDGTVTVRIGAVQREGPLVQVTTPGQVQAGALTRVEVQGTGEAFALAGVEVTVPETRAVQTLMAIDDAWQGVFTPPLQPSPQPLRVQLHGAGGEALVLQHPYRLRVPGEGVVTRVPGTETTRVFAVAVAPDGTVWAGGDGRCHTISGAARGDPRHPGWPPACAP